MGAADDFHQTVHAVMPREDTDGLVHTLSLTICISLCAFAMLGLAAPLMQGMRISSNPLHQPNTLHHVWPLGENPPPARMATLTYGRPYLAVAVDAHAVNNLNCENKDKDGHPEKPSALARNECYAVALDLLLHGRVAFLIVDGASGRAALVAYILLHGGLASPLSQNALRRLGLRLCIETALSATNGESIFLLFIHGYMTIIFLRPSVGSYAFIEYRRNGKHGMSSVMMVVHNQMVLLGRLMGIHLEPFIHDESPLPLIFNTAYQQQITACLHLLGYLDPKFVYRTPMSNGGHAGGKASAALAGTFSERLGRYRLTMAERGDRSVAVAGTWSEALGRYRLTIAERGDRSVAVAGTWSEALGRDRLTMEERGERSVALAGTWSEGLGRDRLTMEERSKQMGAAATEANTETFFNYRYRPNPSLQWSDWGGTRYIHEDGRQDGISRTRLPRNRVSHLHLEAVPSGAIAQHDAGQPSRVPRRTCAGGRGRAPPHASRLGRHRAASVSRHRPGTSRGTRASVLHPRRGTSRGAPQTCGPCGPPRCPTSRKDRGGRITPRRCQEEDHEGQVELDQHSVAVDGERDVRNWIAPACRYELLRVRGRPPPPVN